jgi:hypothetical protein
MIRLSQQMGSKPTETAEKKFCTGCKQLHELKDFPREGGNRCKKVKNEANRQRHSKNKTEREMWAAF